MSELKKYQLQEIASVQTGPFGSQLHQSDYVEVGTPIITVEHLGENRITHNNLPRVTHEDKQRLNKYWLQEGDIVFSRVGSVDRRAYVKKDEDGWLFSGRCLRVRPKKNTNGKYLSYFFGLEDFKKKIRSIAVGATMPSLNTSIMNEIEVILPNENTQIEIASILSSLDDKIELNLQMNQTLEAMAQAIFKEWFINFNFPGFDGELVDVVNADQSVSSLPKGWKMGKLKDVCDIKYGKDHKHLGDGNIPVYGSGGIMRFADQPLYSKHSILIPRKGTLSNLFYVSRPFWSVDTMFYTVIKSEYLQKYLFYLLKTLNLASRNVGSAVPSLTTDVLNKIEIIIPDEKTLKAFELLISSFYSKLEENNCQINSLTQIRDSLLPKLMTGKIEIKN